MVYENNSIKRLIIFANNLEEKLSSIKIIHEKLNELILIASKTHENILQDLNHIKTFINQTNIEQDEDEMIPIDGTKSEWDDDDDDNDDDEEEIESKKLNSDSLNNFSSTIENNRNSIINKRSSNLKKSPQSTSTIKSPKSVTFSIDQNISFYQPPPPPPPSQQQQKRIIPTFHQFSKEKKNFSFNEITTPIMNSSIYDISRQNQFEIPSKFEKTLTNIRIHDIESKNGDYLRLINLSNSDDYDLSEHFLQQNIHSKIICRFRFPFNTIIRAGQTITIWCGRSKGIIQQPPHIFLWKEQRKWETKPECITILAKPNGQSIAWYRNIDRLVADQSSSDILLIHSKNSTCSSEVSNNSLNSTNSRQNPKQNRLLTFNLLGNTKPPFAYSPNHPIHPDYNGKNIKFPNDIRSQMHEKNGYSQLLNRPKSSPFANFTGCKQDLISRNLLKTQQQKPTIIKT